MTPGLEMEDVVIRSSGRALVGPVSLTLGPGERLTVMGETGAGKSLLAQAIIGALPPALTVQGRIVVGGRRVDRLSDAARAELWGRTVTLLHQEPWRALDPLMQSARQVEESHRYVAGRSMRDARVSTDADLAELDVLAARRHLPGALSGGMAQRIAFAAAKAGGAPTVIVDEPTKGLDADRAGTVSALLDHVPREGGSLLTITHDLRIARRLGGTVMILKDGALIESGPAARVLSNPASDYARAMLAAEPSAWTLPRAAATGGSVLRAEELAVGRGGRVLVRNLDIELRRSERSAIVGPSGSGKTSVLDTLAGLLAPLAGRVVRGPHLPATAVQKLYQDPPAAFPVRVALLTSLRDVAVRHGVPWTRVQELLESLRIDPALLARRPSEVSGGELQRIALARVLAIRPAVLLADEPTSRMDPLTQAEVMWLIAQAASDHGTAVMLVTHDGTIAEKWTPDVRSISAVRRLDRPPIGPHGESSAGGRPG